MVGLNLQIRMDIDASSGTHMEMFFFKDHLILLVAIVLSPYFCFFDHLLVIAVVVSESTSHTHTFWLYFSLRETV